MVMYLIEPMQSGAFIVSITMLAFITLAVATQWGWKQAVVAIILLNLFCLIMIVQMIGMDMAMDWSTLLRGQVYQLLISFFLIWAARRVQVPRVLPFEFPPGLARDARLAYVLEKSCAQLLSPCGVMVWTGKGLDKSRLVTFNLHGGDGEPDSLDPSVSTEAIAGPCLFDLKRGKVVAFANERFFQTHMPIGEHEFAAQFGLRLGIWIPISGIAGEGRLVVGMPPKVGIDILRLASELGNKLRRMFDTYGFYHSLEENAAASLRDSLARDLHDSVAQSLAGARYFVDSLLSQSKRGAVNDGDLKSLSELLRYEHSQVVGAIEDLMAPADGATQDLFAVLATMAETMARHWSVAIEFEARGNCPVLSASLAQELKAIGREAIFNAVRHGQASKISIMIEAREGQLGLVISNNGRKFENESARPRTIDARVSNLKGTLDNLSQNDETRISIAIPLGA